MGSRRRGVFHQHGGVRSAKVSPEQYTAQEIAGQIAPADHAPASQKLLRAPHGESVGLQHALQQQLGIRPHMSGIKPENFSEDRKSTRLNSSHSSISYAVFCLKKKKQ